MQGCFIVLESYFQYFHALSENADQGHIVHLLIEAIGNSWHGLAFCTYDRYTIYMKLEDKNII